MNIKTKGQGFDIVSAINTITPKGIEFHLIDQEEGASGLHGIRKSSFTGPNTNLSKRLRGFNSTDGSFSSVITKPINALDNAAMIHDLAYAQHKDLPSRLKADSVLLLAAENVSNNPNSTKIQKFNADVVKIIMKGKIKLGVGVGGKLGDVNALISAGQHLARNSQNESNVSGVIIGLVGLAASIGIPAVIKLINKRRNEKRNEKI